MEREKLTRASAKAHVRQVDEERACWTRFIYGADWRDPALLMPGPLEERFKADLGQRVLTVEGVKDVRLFIHASGRPSVY
jgi:hypothetical protein